ncbi:MAG: endonuclease/exonuclease/phosphatase family protein [Micromonosporaceae bacterium]|nr:endonuclease/exonuclease/phosphatase family protein [Micromonosporaceae bacterium]
MDLSRETRPARPADPAQCPELAADPEPAAGSGSADSGSGRRGGWVTWWQLVLGAAAAGLWVFAVCRLAGIDTFTPLAQLIAFTPYAAAGAVVLTLVAVVARRWRIAVVAALPALILVAVVAPRAMGGDAPPAAGSVPLRVMTVNLWNGNAVDELMAVLRAERPDLLSVQEITPEAVERLESAGLRTLLPHDVARPGPGVTGTALYGRAEFAGARTMDRRSWFDMARASYVHKGVKLDVVAVHPVPPVPGGEAVGAWQRELGWLPRARHGDGAVTMLAGDFNATFDHSAFRSLVDSGYVDAADAVGAGLRPTWQAGRVPPVTLDHVLVEREPGVGVQALRVHVIGGSDHRAVVADVTLPQPR